jgi:asparagine synthase (glutamine-hydrolysing)
MCGIFGIAGSDPITAAELQQMSRLLRHRGPDDEGFLLAGTPGVSQYGGTDTPPAVLESGLPGVPRAILAGSHRLPTGGVALGHRRLSILDLSAHGHQPMVYRDRYWIAYNGEVYNYLELRQELAALGHRFSSQTDTEVILAAYDQWGPGCLSRFNGMWGLAILDLRRKTLFLARDRFGVKPLYYRVAGSSLAFASEIKAFSALRDWRPRANLPRLMDYLVWTVSDHTAQTMFEGVEQLRAGHYLQLDVAAALEGRPATWNMKPARWYSLPTVAVERTEGAAALREALTEAVELRLRADVPVGSCLSGGLDSSSIVCLMSGLLARTGSGENLKTFTARSDDPDFDESGYARMVAGAARSHGTFVTPTPARLFADLPRLVWHQDEPFASSSIFAQWCVFEAARAGGVVVMLDGQGADETLCGYRGFFGAYLAGLARRTRLRAWWRELEAIRRQVGFSRTRLIGYTAAYLWPAALGLIGRFDHRAYSDRGWLAAGHRRTAAADPIRQAGGRMGSVRDMSRAQITATNLPMLLRWEDRNSMAFSVEARVPFLDYRVVELSLQLSDAEKVGGGISKAVLRKSMRGTVPQPVLERRDKMGFVTAEPSWVKQGQGVTFRRELAGAVEALPTVLDPAILRRFDDVVAGRRPFDHRYWRALCAGRWVSTFGVRAEG